MIKVPWDPAGTGGYTGIVIDGFTIRDGTWTGWGGGGILSNSLGVTISNNIIENCTCSSPNGGAGGIYFFGGTAAPGAPLIESNIIRNNQGTIAGGIWLEGAAGRCCWYDATLVNNLIYGNQSTNTNLLWGTGGIDVYWPADATIINCTIAYNTSLHPTVKVGGLHVAGESGSEYGAAAILNSIFWHPGLDDISVRTSDGFVGMNYSDSQDAGDVGLGSGNQSQDPLFVDAPGTPGTPGAGGTIGSADYYLTACSPCVNAGIASFGGDSAPGQDLDGTARPLGGQYDQGAYEWDPSGAPDCNSNGTPDECETLADCNTNGTPDECEVFTDCNTNGTPDECDPDCNSNGTPDECEADCNSDGTPDDCEADCDSDGTPDDCEADCDSDGTPDDCEADCDSDGTPDDCEPDCNTNGTPDDCEVFTDCNSNGTPDECELAGNDCNSDGTPDDCEADCNTNGTPDACETLTDCNTNGTPDECEGFTDCNSNGTPDECDTDCNTNGTPDDCEAFIDCNSNGTPDECELAGNDCNSDGTPDDCEADCDSDGTPDDCEADCDTDGTPDDCEADCDSDGTPDDCEPDDCDADGTPDDCEADTDGDGSPDDCEACPNDANKTDPGVCGCGTPDTDSDGDGVPDCNDGCPNDPAKTDPGVNGCGVPEPGPPAPLPPGQQDTDGVDDATEDGAPNGGDGNADGIPDRQQGNVASLPTLSNNYVTISSPEGTTLADVQAQDNPSPGDAPPGVTFPAGFLSYQVNDLPAVGAGITVEIIVGLAANSHWEFIVDFPEEVVINTYWKFGPTPDNPVPHWYEFLFDGTTGAEITGNVITLHLVDGLRGDDDLTANGVIVDPGAPGFLDSSPAPQTPPVQCDPTPSVILSMLLRVPICGVGCMLAIPATFVGLYSMKLTRRRRRRNIRR